MKTKIIGVAIVLILSSVNLFAQKQSAAAFVESFYKFHRAHSDVFNVSELILYKKWFSAGLNKLFQYELKRERAYLKKNPTNKPHFGDGLPFMPVDECYRMGKYYRHVFKLGAVMTAGGKTIVEVKFYNQKVCGGDYLDT